MNNFENPFREKSIENSGYGGDRVVDPEIARAMAEIEDPFHERRLAGILPASAESIKQGEYKAAEVGRGLEWDKRSQMETEYAEAAKDLQLILGSQDSPSVLEGKINGHDVRIEFEGGDVAVTERDKKSGKYHAEIFAPLAVLMANVDNEFNVNKYALPRGKVSLVTLDGKPLNEIDTAQILGRYLLPAYERILEEKRRLKAAEGKAFQEVIGR